MMGGATMFEDNLTYLEVVDFINERLMAKILELGMFLSEITITRQKGSNLYSVCVRVTK